MPELLRRGHNFIDVLDRVLDRGIVIDAWVRVSVIGIDLITVEAKITFHRLRRKLNYADPLSNCVPVARTSIGQHPQYPPGQLRAVAAILEPQQRRR
jgi:hypothetical protein